MVCQYQIIYIWNVQGYMGKNKQKFSFPKSIGFSSNLQDLVGNFKNNNESQSILTIRGSEKL